LRSLASTGTRNGPSAPLIVAVPDAAGGTPLPAARREADRVTRHLGGHADRLVGEAATVAAVKAALPAATWAHLACHAVTDRDRPSDSRLELADGPLRVRDLAVSTGAGMAYLSACATVRGARGLPDENLHICSAFQLAGFRTVIGTLWPVPDGVAAHAAELTYGRLATHSSAEAVAATMADLRLRYPEQPSAWAGFVHVGDDRPSGPL
jgi:CHAT domain-containing protein